MDNKQNKMSVKIKFFKHKGKYELSADTLKFITDQKLNLNLEKSY